MQLWWFSVQETEVEEQKFKVINYIGCSKSAWATCVFVEKEKEGRGGGREEEREKDA